jgi:hypothetical protein
MSDLPKGEYSGPWMPGPLTELYISHWELETDEGMMSIATAKSMFGGATLEFTFPNVAIVVFQEKPA